ncbi:hypothetical protein PROFUN_02654 [Planoprotostelium fungivorum]|uniref:50S ribosomal protein L32 n=1 Tax=Planoprotostelium fungivorum TaxID=1890364 RepID=A0A2P6NVB1_9EUKA|nr:hypothetical protein PROFUN_02654 [Planoprotostelium fungivorum]
MSLLTRGLLFKPLSQVGNTVVSTPVRGFHTSLPVQGVPQNKPSLRVRRIRHATQRLKAKDGITCKCGKTTPAHHICKVGCYNAFATRGQKPQDELNEVEDSTPVIV